MNGGTPPGIAATAPAGQQLAEASGAHGTRPSAVRHSPLKNAERSSDVAPSSSTGSPATVEASGRRKPWPSRMQTKPASAKTSSIAAPTSWR